MSLLNLCLKTISMLLSLFNFIPEDLNLVYSSEEVTYETVYIPEYNNENLFEGQDNYESNDNYDDAVKLSPNNFYSLNEYQTMLDATLYCDYLTPDYDYYYFTIFTDSYVEIQLNTTCQNCKFSLAYFDYLIRNEDDMINAESSFIWMSNNTNEQSYINYNGLLRPGTYIVYLDNLFDYSTAISYELMLSVEKTEDSNDIYINDLIYNKDSLGAIWLNDYIPFNYYPNISGLSNILYYDFGKQNLNYYDYSLGELSSLIGNESIKSCVVYIWDPTLRIALYEIFVALSETLHSELINHNKVSLDLQLIHDTANKIIKIVGIVNNIIVINKPIQICIDVGLGVLSNVLDVVFQLLMPKFDLDKIQYFAYLNALISCLDIGYSDGENLPDSEELRNINALKIIQIPIFFSFDIQKNFCQISYNETIEHYFENYSFLYNEDVIYANQGNFPFLRGKIFDISQFNDFFAMDSLTLCSDIIAEHRDISLDEEISIDSLHTEEYEWFKFIPNETKKYYLLCYGDKDVKIDVFDYKTKSYVDYNRLYSFAGGYTNISDSSIVGCYADVVLTEGITYYFRVSGEYYSATNDLFFIISDSPREDAVHVHSYDVHIWISTTRHESYCDCGESIICGHAILNNNVFCEICGGRADIGFVGPFSKTIND